VHTTPHEPVQVDQCSDIKGLSVAHDVQDHRGTIFEDEAAICVTAPVQIPYSALPATAALQDLKTFLGRPVLLQRGPVSTAPTNLFSFTVTWNTLATNIPGWDRLTGVQGLRATLKFILETNANPFHQGLLVSSFQYGNSDSQYRRYDKPQLCTHLPHSRLNMSEHTQSTLIVPYLHEFAYIGRSVSEADVVYGRFGLNQVLDTPIVGSAIPVYKLYLALEDIELVGHTTMSTPSTIIPQGGADKELEENGKLSGILATAARVPRSVRRAYPSLAPFASPVEWFLKASAGAAAAFGFSAPVDAGPILKVNKVGAYEHTCDMVRPATTVGGFQGNKVGVSLEASGTDVDEMAFDNILTRYSQIFRGTLAVTDSHGTFVYASHVCPLHFWYRTSTARPGFNAQLPDSSAAAAIVYPSTIMYFAQHFRLYHGGFKYRVTFAKSKFHTGRVMFSFIPGYRDVRNFGSYSGIGAPLPPTFTADIQPTQYSLIFDLKDSSEFEFEVPFFAPFPLVATSDTIGGVSMVVMDPLVANGESATEIEYIIEVAALPGFYFANVTTPGQPVHDDNVELVVLQGGVPPTEGQLVSQSDLMAPSKDVADVTAGEKFMSAKQLGMLNTTNRFSVPANGFSQGHIPHFSVIPAWGVTSPIAANVLRAFPIPRAGVVASCYAFCVGGTTASIRNPQVGAFFTGAYLLSNDNGTATTALGVPCLRSINGASGLKASNAEPSGTALYHVPTYNAAMKCRVGDMRGAVDATQTRNYTFANSASNISRTARNVGVWWIRNGNGTAQTFYAGYGMADDARCIGFIGPAPFILANSTTTAAAWEDGTYL
jgi:hypothetical protein